MLAILWLKKLLFSIIQTFIIFSTGNPYDQAPDLSRRK
ncbi:hypothetical protein AG0111_0g12680 [Alternaria gaisen]|uniref:Uncharacterized protein n=1 Tax=Alternaria gaisen TaxID=167740 RepID=A0ACB6F414_9PLEO|nr:hypothetical protein AG0111_0g12680 [Alternaria gaisen]